MKKGDVLASIIVKLKDLQQSRDTESAHCDADDLLLLAIKTLAGQSRERQKALQIIAEFEALGKWYS